MSRFRICFSALLLVLLVVTAGISADLTATLKAGKADLKSAGALTFGTEGVTNVPTARAVRKYISTRHQTKRVICGLREPHLGSSISLARSLQYCLPLWQPNQTAA